MCLVCLLPESQVQSVVFVLQQLFHRKHGRAKHVHLSRDGAHAKDSEDFTQMSSDYRGQKTFIHVLTGN